MSVVVILKFIAFLADKWMIWLLSKLNGLFKDTVHALQR